MEEKRLTYSEYFILNKLFTKQIIGSRRDLLTNVLKGSPIGERGNLKLGYKSLKKKGFINRHGRKKGDDYISLISSLISVIIEVLDYNRCNECGEYLYQLNKCPHCKKNI